MNNYESSSMFGTLLGTGVGWYFGGPIGGAILGSAFGGITGMFGGRREQKRQQKELAKAQKQQAHMLYEKTKADQEDLYSAVQSSINQTSGAMGAVY